MGSDSRKSTQKTMYGNTSTINPYVISKTNNKGTTSSFVEGSAFDTINNVVNSNIGNVLNNYLNPSLDTAENKALMNTYTNALSANAKKSFENDIVAPLSDRNMIRSSQATNMYKNLSNNLSNNVASYANELLANSQTNYANKLNTLLNAYLQGFNVINANQQQSLNTSKGNSKVSTTSSYSDSLLNKINSTLTALGQVTP